MEKCLLHNFYMGSQNSVGTSDSRSNVPVSVSGVEEGKKTDSDTDSGAGITSPLIGGKPALRLHIKEPRTKGTSKDIKNGSWGIKAA